MVNILEVSGLNFSIEDKKIVNNISISLSQHQILSVLGQSGSGKSTLLKLIAGIEEPDSGKLRIKNERIVPPSEKLIPGHSKIKIVRQDNPLFPNISLRENIEYDLRFFNEDYKNQRVEKLLKVTGLERVADQLPRHSSEGEQQRTAIARALADEPSLLLLDEPFSNLDYKNKSRLKEEVCHIVKEEEMACIFVTHDINDVFGTADELAILRKGKITQRDTPINVFNNPNSLYEASITGDYNLFVNKEMAFFFDKKVIAKKILVRPRDIEISVAGRFEAKVKKVVNKGVLFEIELICNGKQLLSHSMNHHTVGEFIKFDILNYSLL